MCLRMQLSAPLLPSRLPGNLQSFLEHTDIAATDIAAAQDLAAPVSSAFPAPAPAPSYRRALLQEFAFKVCRCQCTITNTLHVHVGL